MASNAKRICLPSTGQPTRIGELPDNVLEEIFRYLTAQELKHAALVCKNWNEVIGSAAVTMKKFKLVIDDSKFDEPFISSRKHQNIELRRTIGHAPDTSIKDKINISGAKTFYSTRGEEGLDDSLGLTQTLELMPLLEVLSVVGYDGPSKHCYTQVHLPKLKRIELKGINAAILQYLTASKVTIVYPHYLSHLTPIQSPSKAEIVSSFVMKCKDIENLCLDTSIVEHFLKSSWKDLKLWFFYLILTTPIADVPSFIANLKCFFASQALTEFICNYDTDGGAVTVVIPTENLLKGVWDNMKYLPKLERLMFPFFKVDKISDLARFNSKLTSLRVLRITGPVEADLQMTSLKALTVQFIEDEDADAWKSIIESSPNLEAVVIGNVVDAQDFTEHIEVLLRHPKMKFLMFSSLEPLNLHKIFNQISSNYGNLKSLTLKQLDFSHCVHGHCLLGSKKSMEFVFPADPTEWNANASEKKRLKEMFPLDKGRFLAMSDVRFR